MLSGMRNVKVAIIKSDTIVTDSRELLESGPRMGEVLFEWIAHALYSAVEQGLATLDLWWGRKFGRTLSGRGPRVEIQTLFHGNTRDQDQI